MTACVSVQPGDQAFLRLPSGLLKAIECKPDQIIEISKFGSITVNSIIGRPYYTTFEVLDKQQGETSSRLRVVTPRELDDERIAADASLKESREAAADTPDGEDAEAIDVVAEDGQAIIKNNRLIVDDNNRQLLSQQEIEALKKNAGGKEIVERILANHTALDEKTAFSKAKYTLRKTRKYIKRFELLPIELGILIEYILNKEPARIMDLREESLALVTAWSNVHWHDDEDTYEIVEGQQTGDGRVLVIDDAGGLLVAAIAERKGLLRASAASDDVRMSNTDDAFHDDYPLPSKANTITLVHPAVQPNISILKFFDYDSNHPSRSHLLHSHLNTLSWLQLLHPEEDPMYQEPPTVNEAEMSLWKPNKKSNYFRKRRRWERCKTIIDHTRQGQFDSLVVATHMDLVSMFAHVIPLLRGGAHVVVYSPTVEPLTQLMDMYSKERRMAYISELMKQPEQQPSTEDFPVDPRLLLAPTLQTSRVREYQVLPSRTHPLMTSRGGSEGYVFTARRVLPLAGGVEARGNFEKKRKADAVK